MGKKNSTIKSIIKFCLVIGVVCSISSYISSIKLNNQFSNSLENEIKDYHLTLVGSFNSWDIEDNTYLLNKEENNVYSIELTTSSDNTEFKIINDNSWNLQYSTNNVKVGTELINSSADNITLLSSSSYYIQVNCLSYKVNIIKLDTSTLSSNFSPITDIWGNNSSVECKEENVILGTKYYRASINLSNQYSACVVSDNYFSKGQFDIYANSNIYDYGTFAFWLTGVVDEVDDKYQEITIELLKGNQIICSTGTNSLNYKQNYLEANFDFNKWHKYSINVLDEKVEFKVDDVVIYTITNNLPTCEDFRINIGLLYPKTGWTGFIEDTDFDICNTKFTNFNCSTL